MLKAGIIGLPNAGKSTLFNALTRSRKAEAANYPFCTLDPNVGIVEVPDERLAPLARLVKTTKVVPAAIEVVDIAGLVAGASQGEGLGNQFLANIREVDALVHVVRCFDDDNIVHTMGSIDPVRDIEIIATELILADLQSIASQLVKNQKRARAQDKEASANVGLLERLQEHLNQNQPAHTLEMNESERTRVKSFCLLSSKPVLYACNITEAALAAEAVSPYLEKVEQYARQHHNTTACWLCVQLEADLSELSKEEAEQYRRELGVQDTGVTRLIQLIYQLLGLASYFTAGEKEVRAWTFTQGMKAPQCAGLIHTDFEQGFIKVEVISYEALVAAGNIHAARQAGKYRLEGKDYCFVDGDVALFRFNVT